MEEAISGLCVNKDCNYAVFGEVCTKCGTFQLHKINTEKCSPVEMRKNLVLVDTFKEAGIDFVPMPVLHNVDKGGLLAKLYSRLDKLESASK